jgi:hypothetical protein
MQDTEKVLFHPEGSRRSEAMDLLFFANSRKQQIPQAKNAFRNDTLGIFPKLLYSTNRLGIIPVWR